MKTKDTTSLFETEDDFDFDVKTIDALERQPVSSACKEVYVDEERLKQDELRKYSNLYSSCGKTQDNDEYAKQNPFKSLDTLKQKMKDKKMSTVQRKPEIINNLVRLETEISAQLFIDEDQNAKSNFNDEYEFDETVVDKSAAISNEENELEQSCAVEQIHEEPNEKIAIKSSEKDEIGDSSESTVSISVNRGALSELSARLSKSRTSKSKKDTERCSQKRKISHYFNPSSKKLNV